MINDRYKGFAERYDWMRQENPAREKFFSRLFTKHHVKSVLDCACGTGKDLMMFHKMGFKSYGSDLSGSMLKQAKRNISQIHIPLKKIDYCELPSNYNIKFDAVVCLSNAINEPLEDTETLRALKSMKAVLSDSGILIFDQGQTDASMREPPRFVPVVNNRDFTRFFMIEYAGYIQTVHIYDFIHTEMDNAFKHTSIKIRIRLHDEWKEILNEAGFAKVEFFGDWDATPYNKEMSTRLIAVAKN